MSDKQKDLKKEQKEELKEEINEKEEKTTENKDMVPKQDYDDLDDRYKRILAEFENFKKRSSKEREGMYNSVLSDVVEVILPILDNLENAVKVETEDANYKQGVEEIEAIGTTFDPELHEAVGSIQDDNLGEKEIAQEYRKGYKIGSKVIRHSMVVVAN